MRSILRIMKSLNEVLISCFMCASHFSLSIALILIEPLLLQCTWDLLSNCHWRSQICYKCQKGAHICCNGQEMHVCSKVRCLFQRPDICSKDQEVYVCSKGQEIHVCSKGQEAHLCSKGQKSYVGFTVDKNIQIKLWYSYFTGYNCWQWLMLSPTFYNKGSYVAIKERL